MANDFLLFVIILVLSEFFVFFQDREEESDATREKFFVPESDHLTLLNVFQQWKQNNFGAQWCTDHFIHVKGLKKAREVHAQVGGGGGVTGVLWGEMVLL